MTKETLYLLPGMMCDRSLWRHQIETLSPLYDIRVADFTEGDSIEHFADRVMADAPKEFSIAGLSMGGYIAFDLLRRCPERIKRVALLNTSPFADTEDHAAFRKAIAEVARDQGMAQVIETLLPKMIHPSRYEDEELVTQVDAMAYRVGEKGFIRQQTALLNRVDSFADLAKIDCPTLIVVGRQDQLTPLKLSKQMAEEIPQAKLVEIETCGHLSTMEQPEAVSAVLRYWMQT
ncbi:alpha/beta fold hydrolase [Terasakiella sp. A23]|uniref:alpha/beta fold hydrolase n=1 Tax=Terasakiella sp. FCG-A23 TaxID=3080561 RepID=UPI0029541BCD|nr:alpha/beta fold hydrolase [Terasakiella sp. A23]MDV7340282.1 alpha/beta fold hydrolase [Terasakiella sp. A23]